MKALIIYASKYGTVADCAKQLKSKLLGEATLVDIKQMDQSLELTKFDTVIIGGSVYADHISKALKSFCKSNLEVLCQKELGLFLCCGLTDQANEFFENNFPPKLLEHAKITLPFGSEARLEKMKFLDKTILKAFAKGDFSPFKILEENIDKFAEAFNSDYNPH